MFRLIPEDTIKRPYDRDWGFQWTNVPDYWPRRLLHIPSMTSIERQGISFYGFIDRPAYSILTYTWGRWKIRSGPLEPTLPVRGTPWKIPSIKPEHFTAEAFQKVINKLGTGGIQWAWVDIACIHQENDEENAAEVGRQAGIFKNATNVYVWLSHLDTERLQAVVDENLEAALKFADYFSQYNGWRSRKILDPDALMEFKHNPLPVPMSFREVVESMTQGLEFIFKDPWFSSLWTLQEVVLRNDAIVLTKQADMIQWRTAGDYKMFLTMFINFCHGVYDDGVYFKNKMATHRLRLSPDEKDTMRVKFSDVQAMVDRTMTAIERAGFCYFRSLNPNVPYGTARYRQTSRPEDRVYAITQVYNLRVGKSIRPSDNPTLEELKEEFAQAIINRCPILGQLFLHLRKPRPRRSWQITEESGVPDRLLFYEDPRPECRFTFQADGSARVRGRVCAYSELSDAVGEKSKDWAGLLLDQETPSSGSASEDLERMSTRKISRFHKRSNTYQPEWMADERNLWILHLGSLRGSHDPSLAERFRRMNVGLLICRERLSAQIDWLDVPYQRKGVYIWQIDDGCRRKLEAVRWAEREVLLH